MFADAPAPKTGPLHVAVETIGTDAPAGGSIPKILSMVPSACFVRNPTPEEEALAQKIFGEFISQNSPQAGSVADMPSRGTEASNVRHGASGPQHTQGKGSSDDRARFFPFTITVRPNNDHVGDRSCRIESVTSSLENYVRKTGEGVLDLFFDGKCLTLHGAMRFSATHSRAVLR